MIDFDTNIWKVESGNQWEAQDKSIFNRGFLFGDGLFETMIYIKGSIRFSQLHQNRLREGCRILGFETENISNIQVLENELKNRFGTEKNLRIRWMIFRDGLGKYTPETNECTEMIQVQPFAEGIKIKAEGYISKSITVPAAPWSHCKTMNALTYVMANKERIKNRMDEVILFSPQGYISEAGSANIFWVKDGQYFTPSLACNGIAGIGRQMIIQKLKEENKLISEGEFFKEALLEADQIFTSNVTGISYLQKIDGKPYDVTPIHFLEGIFQI